MAIRRKEKPLTLDELKDKLSAASIENWIHGDPLCAYTPLIDGGKIITLSPKVENSLLMIFLLDSADYATDRSLEVLTKWQDRYRKLAWTPIIAFRSKYDFQKNPRFFDRFRQMGSFQALPLLIDPQDELFSFYDAKGPTLVFSDRGETIFNELLQPDFEKQVERAESSFQQTLHRRDPGLPLLEVEPTKLVLPIDHATQTATQLGPSGYWTNAENSIASDDPSAKLTIPFSGTHLRLVAITHPNARENTKAQIFLDDVPLASNIHGAQVHPGDRGQSVFEVNKHTGIYELVKSERKIQGVISVKFLNALENPVIIYEARIV
jgi:hypothetical protein